MKKLSFLLVIICLFIGSNAFAIASSTPATIATVAVTASNAVDISPEKAAKLQKKMEKLQKKAEKSQSNAPKGDKSWIASLVLCWLVGILGIHRFYLGYIWQGVVQLLTLGGFGIWTLIDLIRIIIKDLQPKDGSYTD